MPIQDPFTLPFSKPADSVEKRDFSENGYSFTLVLSARRDYTREMLADEKAERYIERYVKGEEIRQDDGTTAHAIAYPRAIGGIIPAVGEWLCYVIARIEMMQVTVGEEVPLTFDQWAAYGVLMPETMKTIANWSYSLMKSTEKDLKNGSGEAAAP